MQFKHIFNFKDLFPAPSHKNKKKRNLSRRIELQAPLYALRKLLLHKAWTVSDTAIKEYQAKLWQQIEQNKPK
jgi:hypothetical protein